MTAWKKTFVSAFIAQICSIMGFSFAMPFLPFYIKELGVKTESEQSFWAGLCLGAAGVTLAIFSPIWGHVADRHGRKLMVVRSMFGGTLVLVLMALVRTPAQLFACRLLQGMLTGTIAASVALVASVTPSRRTGFALGMMNSAVFIGVAGGPFIGGLVADWFGYRNAFLCGAVLTLLGGMVALFGTREEFRPPDGSQPPTTLSGIFLLPGFAAAVAIMLAVRLSNSTANPSFPLIVEHLHANPATLNTATGFIVAIAAISGAISSAVLGLLGDRFGHRYILMACCAGAAAVSFGHAFADTMTHLIILRVLFGATVAGMLPAANSAIANVAPPDSVGKAFGWANAVSLVGFAIGPFLGGYIGMVAGLWMPFVITGMGQISVLLIVLFLMPSRTPKRSAEAPAPSR